jgi:hypothetical protein
MQELERRHRMRITCQHIRKYRVFSINGVHIKFSSGYTPFFCLEQLQKKINSNQSKSKLIKMNESLICIRREEIKEKLYEMYREVTEMIREGFCEEHNENTHS